MFTLPQVKVPTSQSVDGVFRPSLGDLALSCRPALEAIGAAWELADNCDALHVADERIVVVSVCVRQRPPCSSREY